MYDSRVSPRRQSHSRRPTVFRRQHPKKLHGALPAVPNELQSRISFHPYRITASCRQPHRLRRSCARTALLSARPEDLGSSRVDRDRHDLSHHVKCTHLFELVSTFGWIRSVGSVSRSPSSSHLSSTDGGTPSLVFRTPGEPDLHEID